MSSLINRIEISNFLDATKGAEWNPTYRHQILDLLGQNAAIQLLNGAGKTVISNAFLGVLSRHKTLVSRMAGTFATKESGIYTHFRVEFVECDGKPVVASLLDTPNRVVGETYVFGVCGYCDDKTGLKYYCYPGRLEDVPVATTFSNKETTLFLNEEFQAEIKAKSDRFFNNISVEDWGARVHQHWPEQSLLQMVNFQLNGGGDASASLYNTKVMPGEKYSQSFFYTHIAPYLTIGNTGNTENKSGFFNREILVRSMSLINAQLEGEKKAKTLARQQKIADIFNSIKVLNDKVIDAQQKYKGCQGKIGEVASALKLLVEDSPLFGLPKLAEIDNKQVERLVRNIVVIPDSDEPFLLKDAGFAELVGKEVKHLNQAAKRQNIKTVKDQQVLEIMCDLAQNKQVGGHQPQLYSKESLLNFIDRVDEEYLSAAPVDGDAKGAIKELINTAFSTFEKKCDTSPFRKEMQQVAREIQTLENMVAKYKSDLEKLDTEKTTLLNRLETFKIDEIAFKALENSLKFTEEELKEPLQTKEKLDKELSRLNQVITDNTAIYSGFKSEYHLYEEFKNNRPNTLPADFLNEIVVEEKRLKTLVQTIKSERNIANQNLADIKSKVHGIQAKILDIRPKYDSLEVNKTDFQTISESFPEEEIDGFTVRIGEKKSLLVSEISRTKTEKKAAQKGYAYETQFYDKAGTIDPAQWLDDIERERSTLAVEQNSLVDEIKQLQIELEALEKNKVAAGPNAQYALQQIPSEVQSVPLHSFIKEQVPNKAKAKQLLTLFSSMLFAPVVEGKDNIAKVLQVFKEAGRDILLPVFNKTSLQQFLADEKIQIEEFDDLASFLFVGKYSGIVECILDPEKIATRKSGVKAEKAIKESRLKEVKNRLAETSSNSEIYKLATKAKESVDEQYGLKTERLNKELEVFIEDQKRQNFLFPKEVIKSISKAEKFVELGGMDVYLKVYGEYTQALEAQKNLENTQKDKEDQYNVLCNQFDSANQNYSDYQNKNAKTKINLETIIQFLPENLERYRAAKNAAQVSSERRIRVESKTDTKYDFNAASRYIKTIAVSNKDELKKQLDEIDSKEKDFRKFLKRDKLELDDCIERYRLSGKQSARYDVFLAEVMALYKLAFKNVREIDYACENQVLIKYVEECRTALAEVNELSLLLDTAPSIIEVVTKDNFAVLNAEANQALSEISQAKDNFEKHCSKELKKPTGLLSLEDQEGDMIREMKDEPEKIDGYVERVDSILIREKEDYHHGKENEEKIKESLAANLASLTIKAKTNLKVLRRVLGNRGEDEATFNINSTIASSAEITASIEEMIHWIKVKHERHLVQLEDPTQENDKTVKKHHEATLDAEITKRCYRSIFPNPTITYKHPDIRGGRYLEFDIQDKNKTISEGQKTSLALMMQVAMAQYAQARKLHDEYYAGNRRSKESAASPGILFIDGLFSALSKPSLIQQAFKSIKATQGAFQIIGLIHNPVYVATHDFNIFPVLYVGKSFTDKAEDGSRQEWVSIEQKQKADTMGFASFHVNKTEVTADGQ